MTITDKEKNVRRGLLKFAAATTVGIATGVLEVPFDIKLSQITSRATGRSTASAGVKEEINERCGQMPSDPCVRNYVRSEEFQTKAVIISPLAEEAIFRGVPSLVLDIANDLQKPDSPSSIIVEGGPLTLTRRELLVGAATSVVFGACHNLTQSGFDTNTIPVPQTTGGLVYWYLQRKFGFVANTVSHAAFNYSLIRRV